MHRLRDPVLALVVLLASGCPDAASTKKGGAPSTCLTRSAQCKLPNGTLGVCNDVACPAGKEPPCLGCVSQH